MGWRRRAGRWLCSGGGRLLRSLYVFGRLEFKCQLELELETNLRCETRLTALPCGTEVAARLAGVDVREGAWRCCRVGAGVLCVSELEVGEGGA